MSRLNPLWPVWRERPPLSLEVHLGFYGQHPTQTFLSSPAGDFGLCEEGLENPRF